MWSLTARLSPLVRMGNLSFHTQHKDGTFVHTLTDHAGSSFVADTHTAR